MLPVKDRRIIFRFNIKLGNRFPTSFRHSRFIMKKSYFQP